MKLSEFKKKLDKVISSEESRSKLYGNYYEPTVCIYTEGMSGSRTEVHGIGAGFDWYNGSIMISTKEPVNTYGLKYISKLQELYRKEVFKVKFNPITKKWMAKYKKDCREFDKECTAYLWCSNKMNKEINPDFKEKDMYNV